MKVPWLSQKKIQSHAKSLIDEYEIIVGHNIQPPVPVEQIIERVLNLTLGYENLKQKMGVEDALGAIYLKDRKISVDNSLLPVKFEGRLCFTFAHEAGHWVLHRNLVDKANRTEAGSNAIFCRIKDVKQPIEWQADYFASCLLMPAKDVRNAFMIVYGKKPIIIYNVKSAFCGPLCYDPSVETWPMIAQKVIDVGGFSNVSKQAMIIRLQNLGLVINETHVRLTWAESFATA